MFLARSKICLSCKYCRRLRSDESVKNDISNNYTCDYLIITGSRGVKGDNLDNCLLYAEDEDGGYDV